MKSNSSKDWFEDWFDSPYYHLLYKDRNHEEAEVFIDTLVAHLGVEKATVLDLACGKGRHAYQLAQKGMDVVGLDLSPQSIQSAQETYASVSLEFYVHDMRLPFRINYFDYVFNFFTSIGYFRTLKDNVKVLNGIYKGLKSDGFLLIDFMNVHKVLASLVPSEEKVIEGVVFKIERHLIEGRIVKKINIMDAEQCFSFEESVQALTPAIFGEILEEAHFEMIQTWGNYRLDPYVAETSDRYIVLAKKKLLSQRVLGI